MGKRNLYDLEKVLYFADQKKGLHVSVTEADDTDLSILVEEAVEDGLIRRVADDDSGWYYQTTLAGEIRLVELQIAWRQHRGRNVDSHKKRLAKLKGEENAD